jgi:hypothetical protein
MMIKKRISESMSKANSRQAANAGILLLIISFVSGFVPYVTSSIKVGGRDYQTGDWLINYSGGFVRRGLMGDLIIHLFPSGNIGLWLLLVLQSCLYLTVYLFFVYILNTSESNWLLTSMICSPIGICFYGWDTAAFGRKEVLGFLVLILLFVRRENSGRVLLSRVLMFFSFATFAIGVFSWEPIALLLPFILTLLNFGNLTYQGLRARPFSNAIFIFTGIVGFLVSIVNKGTTVQSMIICDKINSRGLAGSGICTGAIDAIGWPVSYARQLVENSYPQALWYLLFFILGLVPIFASRSFSTLQRPMITGIIFLLPLFFLVNDYGRLISMYFICLLIAWSSNRNQIRNHSRLVNTSYFGLFFTLAWGIPVSVNSADGFPIINPIFAVLNAYLEFSLPGKLAYSIVLVAGLIVWFAITTHSNSRDQTT